MFLAALMHFGFQHLKEPFRQLRRFQNCAQQDEAAARVFVPRYFQQRLGNFRIPAKALGAINQPAR